MVSGQTAAAVVDVAEQQHFQHAVAFAEYVQIADDFVVAATVDVVVADDDDAAFVAATVVGVATAVVAAANAAVGIQKPVFPGSACRPADDA